MPCHKCEASGTSDFPPGLRCRSAWPFYERDDCGNDPLQVRVAGRIPQLKQRRAAGHLLYVSLQQNPFGSQPTLYKRPALMSTGPQKI